MEVIVVDNGSTDNTKTLLVDLINKINNPSIKSVRVKKNIGYGHGIMGGAITVHSEESYNETIAQINNGTYESHYQKRMGTKTPLPSDTAQNEEKGSFARLLAKVF